MKSLFVFALGLLVVSTSSQAAWEFHGVWNSYLFTAYEYPQDRLVLNWDDGTPGFIAYYNPHPVPTLRCPCQTYETSDGRKFLLESYTGGPTLGWYRGIPFTVSGRPVPFDRE